MKTTPGVSLKPVPRKNRSVLKLLTFWHGPATSSSMIKTLMKLILSISLRFEKTSDLALENLALRQQVAIMKRSAKRPRLRNRDRLFWILLARFWRNWQESLIVVKPETVIRWHRKGFKLFWKFNSRRKGPGRPPISSEIRDCVRRMAKANPLWGAPRIHGELLKPGIDYVSERTVSNIIKKCRPPKPPSQTWRTFLKNHMQNTYVERIIGSIRRECLDHIIVLNEEHLNLTLTEYFAYSPTLQKREGFRAKASRVTP